MSPRKPKDDELEEAPDQVEGQDLIPADVRADIEGEDEAPQVDSGPGEQAGGPQHILVDVRAVAESSPQLAESWARDHVEAMMALHNLLAWVMGDQGFQITLVALDSDLPSEDLPEDMSHLHLHLVPEGQTVSEELLRMLEDDQELGRQVTVVSSDLDVIRRTTQVGARANLADLFAASLILALPRERPQDDLEEPPHMSEREREEWRAFCDSWRQRRE